MALDRLLRPVPNASVLEILEVDQALAPVCDLEVEGSGIGPIR